MMKEEEKRIDMEVGKRLKAIRHRRKMSQENLASEVGLTFQQIQKYEKGINRIAASRLYQFSCILNISPLYFFDNLDTVTNYRPLAFANYSYLFQHD